jgi:hypothetical protein
LGLNPPAGNGLPFDPVPMVSSTQTNLSSLPLSNCCQAQDARPALAHEQRSLVLPPDVSMVSFDPKAVRIIQSETLVRWHRAGFRCY